MEWHVNDIHPCCFCHLDFMALSASGHKEPWTGLVSYQEASLQEMKRPASTIFPVARRKSAHVVLPGGIHLTHLRWRVKGLKGRVMLARARANHRWKLLSLKQREATKGKWCESSVRCFWDAFWRNMALQIHANPQRKPSSLRSPQRSFSFRKRFSTLFTSQLTSDIPNSCAVCWPTERIRNRSLRKARHQVISPEQQIEMARTRPGLSVFFLGDFLGKFIVQGDYGGLLGMVSSRWLFLIFLKQIEGYDSDAAGWQGCHPEFSGCACTDGILMQISTRDIHISFRLDTFWCQPPVSRFKDPQ